MAKPWLIRYFQCFYTGNTCRPWSHAITILRRKFWFFLMKFLNDLLLFSWSSFVMRIIYPYSMYSLNGLISFINTSAVCSENFEKIECSQNQKYNLNWMYHFQNREKWLFSDKWVSVFCWYMYIVYVKYLIYRKFNVPTTCICIHSPVLYD